VYLTDGVTWRSFCGTRENGVAITLSATPPKLVEEFFFPLDHDMDMKSRLNHYQNMYKKLEQWEYDLVMSMADNPAKKIDITGYLQAFVVAEVKKRLSPTFEGLLSERNLTELVDYKVWHLQGEIGRRICDYRYSCEFSDENA
jgi:hypothetical protein